MPLLNAEQRTDAWLEARRGRITASVAAACLGLNPYTSRAAAWRSILGIAQKPENRHMRWGTEFEPEARRAFEVESGELVTETGFWVHPQHDWLGASPDGLIGDDGLLEIKIPTHLPDAIPLHHRIQIAVQLMVTGRKRASYWAWTHEGAFHESMTLPDEAAEWLVGLEAFYRDYVLTEIEPPRFKSGEKKAIKETACHLSTKCC